MTCTLRFSSPFSDGRASAFPGDARSQVGLDANGAHALNNDLVARTATGSSPGLASAAQ